MQRTIPRGLQPPAVQAPPAPGRPAPQKIMMGSRFANRAKPLGEITNKQQAPTMTLGRLLAQQGTPLKPARRKKRSARPVPIVANYNPLLSPCVENKFGELPTPAREALLSRRTEQLEHAGGRLCFDNVDSITEEDAAPAKLAEQFVTEGNAVTGLAVVVSDKYREEAPFAQFKGKEGKLMQGSSVFGGVGWIVDWGPAIGCRFFTIGNENSQLSLAKPQYQVPAERAPVDKVEMAVVEDEEDEEEMLTIAEDDLSDCSIDSSASNSSLNLSMESAPDVCGARGGTIEPTWSEQWVASNRPASSCSAPPMSLPVTGALASNAGDRQWMANNRLLSSSRSAAYSVPLSACSASPMSHLVTSALASGGGERQASDAEDEGIQRLQQVWAYGWF
ncbi:hypothetical protein T484DRAFT_1887200 [Baffinella frigidus]|nr:hypothetical protein T484DRAFT_1887200 [Cryptophyta sp. CCMP2293]